MVPVDETLNIIFLNIYNNNEIRAPVIAATSIGTAVINNQLHIGYSIFVGVEFFSLWGDITAWGIDGIPDQRVSAQDFIDLVREKDGFFVSCHPFRSNNRGLREHLRDVHGLDGVEVLNGSTPLEENRTALRFCRELGLKAIGASDAHVPGQVGKYVTWLPETVTTLPDFVTALHTLETRPAIWTGSGYDVVTEF